MIATDRRSAPLLTPRRVAILRRVWGSWSLTGIAADFGVEVSQVEAWAKKLGLGQIDEADLIPPGHNAKEASLQRASMTPALPRGWTKAEVADVQQNGTPAEMALVLSTLGMWPGLPKDEAARGMVR